MKPVLAGADQPQRRAVLGVERLPVEALGQQDVLAEHVVEQRDGPVAVAAHEPDVGGGPGGAGDEHLAVEGGERDALPAQDGGRPTRHAMEVGDDLAARQRPAGSGEARCLVLMALFVGSHFVAADHGTRSRREVMEWALERLLV